MKEISTSELQQLLEHGEQLNLVDVREPDEVVEGMIPGAIHIPLGEIPERLDELDKTKSYIIICRSGGRSGHASAFLADNGYDITNMVGGMMNWAGAIE